MTTSFKTKYILLFLISFAGSSLFAQLKYTFPQFGNETVDFIKQPVKWDGKDWLKIGLISGGTFLIMETADQPLRDFVLKERSYYNSVPIEFGRMWGELYSPILLFSGFAIHSLITDDIGTRKIAYEIGQASLYAGAITYLLKCAIGRSRPFLNQGNSTYHPFASFINDENQSLPSGHSTIAIILSTVLSRNVQSDFLKILAYVPTVLTMSSRVYQDKHWVSDTFLGAAIGYFIATWVIDQHENNNTSVGTNSMYPLTISITF